MEEFVIDTVDNRGKNPPYYCESGIPIIDNFMIKNNGYPDLKNATRYLDNYLFNNFIRKYNEIDDVLITLVGNGIGNIALFPKEKSAIIQNTIGLRFKDNKKFMYYTLLSKNGMILKLDRGMAQPSIRQDELKDIDINIPIVKEQDKIAKLMTNIDNLITLHQRKSLINLYSWEQRKLGDVSFFKQGSQVDLDKQYSDLNENRVRFIRIVDYTQNTDDIRYIDKELSNNIINEKDVVIVRYGATAGFVGHGITGVLANNMFTVNPENDVAKDYLYIYLKQDKIYKKLNNSNGSSAMPALNFGTVKDVGIAYPLVAEQEKIGELFTNLDNLITLHQRKKNREGND